MRKLQSLLGGALLVACCAIPGAAGAQAGLTRHEVVQALSPYRYISYWHTSNGHGGILEATEGVYPSNDQLYRFVFWIGDRQVRSFSLYAARIVNATPDAVTVMTTDVVGAQRAYLVFHWDGRELLASRPLPRQRVLGGASGTSTGGKNSGGGSVPRASSRPGYLGIETTNAPSDWAVQGCEVLHAYPGTPAAEMGLLGAEDRTDPVGDVISSLTLNGAMYATPNCAALTNALSVTSPGESVQINYYYRAVSLLSAAWASRIGVATLTTQPCPAPLTGRVTSSLSGNRIDLTVKVSGPTATSMPQTVILDTGGYKTYFPDSLLRRLGFTPYGTTTGGGVVSGATSTVYLYRIPAADFLVLDQGAYVPLASGTLVVQGFVSSTLEGFGPDILKLGDSFSNSGSSWTLALPCPY